MGAIYNYVLSPELSSVEIKNQIKNPKYAEPGFPGLGFVLGYNGASFDCINKGFPQDQGQENWRIQWVKAARMPFA